MTRSPAATKADLRKTETALRADLRKTETALRADLRKTETSLRSDLTALITKTETSLRSDLTALITKTETSLRSDLEAKIREEGVETRRHFDVVAEQMKSWLTAMGEARDNTSADSRIADLDKRHGQRLEDVEAVVAQHSRDIRALKKARD